MDDQSSTVRREPESVVALATPSGVLRPARNGPAQSGRIGLRVRLRPAGPGRCVLHVAHSRGSGSAPGNFPRASSISPPTQSNPADPCRIRSIPGEREIRRKARKSCRFSPNPPRSPGRKIEFDSRRLHQHFQHRNAAKRRPLDRRACPNPPRASSPGAVQTRPRSARPPCRRSSRSLRSSGGRRGRRAP